MAKPAECILRSDAGQRLDDRVLQRLTCARPTRRKMAFNLEKAPSIGEKSGEYTQGVSPMEERVRVK